MCVENLYKERDFSKMIVLPNKRFTVNNVFGKLDVKTVGKLVWLTMAKFEIELEASLEGSF